MTVMTVLTVMAGERGDGVRVPGLSREDLQ